MGFDLKGVQNRGFFGLFLGFFGTVDFLVKTGYFSTSKHSKDKGLLTVPVFCVILQLLNRSKNGSFSTKKGVVKQPKFFGSCFKGVILYCRAVMKCVVKQPKFVFACPKRGQKALNLGHFQRFFEYLYFPCKTVCFSTSRHSNDKGLLTVPVFCVILQLFNRSKNGSFSTKSVL